MDNRVFDKFVRKESRESIITKIPPHSTEAEIGVLSALMLNKDSLLKVAEIIDEDSFYDDRHKYIFSSIISLNTKGKTPDIISIAEELKSKEQFDIIGGYEYLAELNTAMPTSAHIESHALIIQEKFLKRKLIEVSTKILQNAYDDSKDALGEIDIAEAEIFKIAENRFKNTFKSLKDLSYKAFNILQKLKSRTNDSLTGVGTGFIELDKMLGGFQNSDLIIIAARPSMGKTALALSIARKVALAGDAVGLFSIEMAAVQIVTRLLSSEAQVDQQKLRTGTFNQEDEDKLVKAVDLFYNLPIYIDDSGMLTLMELRSKCRRLKNDQNVKVIIVDYLQLIQSPKAESREREISLISQTLKQIAKELDIPVIALAQLNRSVEARSDKRPMLSDLRESGSIEQDADVVMFVNRPEVYGIEFYDKDRAEPTKNTAELIIGKQRNGPTGVVRVAFLNNFARFDNLAYGYEERTQMGNSTPISYISNNNQNDSGF